EAAATREERPTARAARAAAAAFSRRARGGAAARPRPGLLRTLRGVWGRIEDAPRGEHSLLVRGGLRRRRGLRTGVGGVNSGRRPARGPVGRSSRPPVGGVLTVLTVLKSPATRWYGAVRARTQCVLKSPSGVLRRRRRRALGVRGRLRDGQPAGV